MRSLACDAVAGTIIGDLTCTARPESSRAMGLQETGMCDLEVEFLEILESSENGSGGSIEVSNEKEGVNLSEI